MAIARKPKPAPSVDVEALIEKGGSSPKREREKPATGRVDVQLRIPPALLDRVDRALQAMPVPMPRNSWVLQAVVEKLERDGIE